MDRKREDKHAIESYQKVVEHFKGNRKDANKYFFAANKALNGKSPINLLGENRAKDLNRFIDNDLRGKK